MSGARKSSLLAAPLVRCPNNLIHWLLSWSAHTYSLALEPQPSFTHEYDDNGKVPLVVLIIVCCAAADPSYYIESSKQTSEVTLYCCAAVQRCYRPCKIDPWLSGNQFSGARTTASRPIRPAAKMEYEKCAATIAFRTWQFGYNLTSEDATQKE
jgi:hypothetical protein